MEKLHELKCLCHYCQRGGDYPKGVNESKLPMQERYCCQKRERLHRRKNGVVANAKESD